MTGRKVFLILVALVASCTVASAQEEAGAGKLELGGFPGGGLWFVGGDDNTEVDFNNYAFGGDATWYVNPKAAVEVEASFGPGIAQDVNYRHQLVYHVKVPHSVAFGGNVLIFPSGSARRLAPYVTGGVGTLRLVSRLSTQMVFGLADAESFLTTNVGGGVKIFRRGDARNWGFRIDYRTMMVNSNSGAVAFFARNTRRIGHRFYVGMLYTMKR